jgi:precorrin-6B methylase 2
MTDLILHKNEDYIEEDLAYYFSSKRDINKQIRPDTDIYSLTPNSPHFNIDFSDGKIGNLFTPIAPYSIERIYIGISFPLFANNSGEAFLRYLMTRINAKGSVILPVYPEMQASEKNFWSRSILENSFLSRSRWKGISNIWAENDGVMSLRIGRRFPAEIKSTVAYFFEEAANSIVRRSLKVTSSPTPLHESLFNLGNRYWCTANTYAITEQIIQDYFGMKKPVTFCDIGNSSGLLGLECLLSKNINVKQAVSFIADNQMVSEIQEVSNRFYTDISNRFTPIKSNASDTLNHAISYDIICFINATLNCSLSDPLIELLANALEKLLPGGILIIYEEQGLSTDILHLLDTFSDIKYYSSLVASQLDDDETISHYSSAIERELLAENEDRRSTFRVIKR